MDSDDAEHQQEVSEWPILSDADPSPEVQGTFQLMMIRLETKPCTTNSKKQRSEGSRAAQLFFFDMQ
jgi:hypothetical protein